MDESRLRVAIAHEWLVVYAGSERVVEQIRMVYPGGRLLTTVVRPERLPSLLHGAEPSFLQRLPGATERHELLVPLMPLSWRLRRPIRDVDVVVTSSHACSNGVRVASGIPRVSYCHTPMRYAWEFELEKGRFPRWARPGLQLLMRAFRRWDRRKAQAVDIFCANSADVAQRVARCYGREARVVHPPVNTEYFTPGAGPVGDHFLYVGRLVSYKRPDLVVEAFAGLPDQRLRVIGSGPLESQLRAVATPNVKFLGAVSDAELLEQYRSAKAMIFCAHEDFGIAMAEAQACGTPLIAYARGGALDIVTPGVSGWLISDQSVGELRSAVREAAQASLDRGRISQLASRFSEERFRTEMAAVVAEAAMLRDRSSQS